MNGNAKLEIHFHDESRVSVQTEISASSEAACQFAELLLFACYTLRILYNLGHDRTSNSLAFLLANTNAAALNALALPGKLGGVELEDHHGREGNKVFRSSLQFDDDENVQFILNTKGFGLLGVGLGYYAPHSVIALQRYLARRHSEDLTFLNKLALTQTICGENHLERKISVRNQGKLAYEAAFAPWIMFPTLGKSQE